MNPHREGLQVQFKWTVLAVQHGLFKLHLQSFLTSPSLSPSLSHFSRFCKTDVQSDIVAKIPEHLRSWLYQITQRDAVCRFISPDIISIKRGAKIVDRDRDLIIFCRKLILSAIGVSHHPLCATRQILSSLVLILSLDNIYAYTKTTHLARAAISAKWR